MKLQDFHGEVWINAHQDVVRAMAKSNNEVIDGGYGLDSYSRLATELMQQYFEEPIYTTFAINGTAANVMALKAMLQRYDSIICAEQTHVNTYEAGAFEYNLGNKILPVKTPDGKLTPEILDNYLLSIKKYKYNPKVITLAQPTEFGTLYSIEELKQICNYAHANGMYVYLDGARIGNAVVALNTNLKEMIEYTDIDAFSFGGTKAGAMFGEMIVFRRKEFSSNLKYSQKQSLQHMSKSKFLSVQICTILKNNLWIELSKKSNEKAGELAGKVSKKSYKIYYERQTNMVFIVISPEKLALLEEKYDMHYWDEHAHILRLATTYQTTTEQIDKLLSYL